MQTLAIFNDVKLEYSERTPSYSRQRYKCKDYGFQFTQEHKKGKDLETKRLAVILYVMRRPPEKPANIHSVDNPNIDQGWGRVRAEFALQLGYQVYLRYHLGIAPTLSKYSEVLTKPRH